MSGHKDGDNTEEVFSQFLLAGSLLRMLCAVAENHDPHPNFLKDVFQQVEGKAAQAVLVGNGNLLDKTSECLVQKGEKVRPFPVEP